jgi:hypothetical protein
MHIVSLAELGGVRPRAHIVINTNSHEWVPILPPDSGLVWGTDGPKPFSDFGPNVKWFLQSCGLGCANTDMCKKRSTEAQAADAAMVKEYLANFNTLFGVTQNKKTALLVRTRKKNQKLAPKAKAKTKAKKPDPDSDTEDDSVLESEADVDEADAEPDADDAEPEDSDADADVEPDAEAEAEPDAEAPEPESDTEPEAESDEEAVPDSDTGSDSDSD